MNDIYKTRCTLLQKARDLDDSQAWNELIAIYQKYIYMIIRSMNVSQSDADDLAQQVTVLMWKNLSSFEHRPGKSKFRHWISRITRNTVLNFIRTQKNKQLVDADIHQNSYIDEIVVPDVEVLAQREWARFITNTAMDNIATHFSENAIRSFQMHADGLSVHAIAAELSVAEDSVYKYIHRIRNRLLIEIDKLKGELNL